MTRARFLHTSDWQLGMTRHFLEGEAQSRYAAARIDAIRSIAAVARREDCDFVVVAGDVFEANLLGSQTVRRALEAMRDFTCPVYLLPGNHDPLDASCIYRSSLFTQTKPDLVHALTAPGPVSVLPGVEIVAAPLHSNRPLTDLAAAAAVGLPADGTLRVLVAHGQVETLAPADENPAVLRLAPMEDALRAGAVHYVALGDRHSRTAVGDTGRIHYSGSPEVTSFREDRPGDVLLVDLDTAGALTVEPRHVGTWSFVDLVRAVDTTADLDALELELGEIGGKERTVVRTAFTGTLCLADKARLDEIVTRYADLFAALYPWERHTDVAVVVDGDELTDLGVGGFVAEAAAELAAAARSGEQAAGDALSLLYRLAGGGGR